MNNSSPSKAFTIITPTQSICSLLPFWALLQGNLFHILSGWALYCMNGPSNSGYLIYCSRQKVNLRKKLVHCKKILSYQFSYIFLLNFMENKVKLEFTSRPSFRQPPKLTHLLHIIRLFIDSHVGGGHRVALLVFGGVRCTAGDTFWSNVPRGAKRVDGSGTDCTEELINQEWRSELSIESVPPLSRGQSASSKASAQLAQLRPSAAKYTGRLGGWQDNKLHISTSSHLGSAHRPVHLGQPNRAR